jgi:hypothetical protein
MDAVLLNSTIIQETGTAYLPIEIYYVLVAISFIFFFLSIMFRQSDDINGILAFIFFGISALVSANVQMMTLSSQVMESTVYVVPTFYHPQITYVAMAWGLMAIVCLINMYRIWLRNLQESAENKKQNEQMEYDMERQKRGF